MPHFRFQPTSWPLLSPSDAYPPDSDNKSCRLLRRGCAEQPGQESVLRKPTFGAVVAHCAAIGPSNGGWGYPRHNGR
jgi:hypothetical protein